MLPNIWFVISGFLLGTSFWIDLSQREQKQKQQQEQQQHIEQVPLSICVYRTNNNKTEWCIYHYEL